METKTKEKSKNKVKSILINPIGGLIYNDTVKQWVYQRPVFNGLYIDSFTIDVAIPLADMLKIIGFKVYSTRLLNKIYRGYNDKSSHNIGESQQPRYRECAIQYLKSITTPGRNEKEDDEKKYVPEQIYSDGKNMEDKDFNSRINYAKWLNVDLMISIDATTYLNDIGMEVVVNKNENSEYLGNCILDEVAKRTRSSVKGVSFMSEPLELRYNALMIPSIILKCGSSADIRSAGTMTQGWWRQHVSLGVYSGIIKFLNINLFE